MNRINLVNPATATGKVKEVFDDMERVRGKGRVSNLFRAYANFPDLLEANWNQVKILMRGGKLPYRLKEAIMLTVADANRCDY